MTGSTRPGDLRAQLRRPAVDEDFALACALARVKSPPGGMLFRWKPKVGEDRRLTPGMGDAAPRRRCGEIASAKVFGAFRASSIVAAALPDPPKEDEAARLSGLKQSIGASANFLANTPAVARGSYLHPLVQAAFTDATLDPAGLSPALRGPG